MHDAATGDVFHESVRVAARPRRVASRTGMEASIAKAAEDVELAREHADATEAAADGVPGFGAACLWQPVCLLSVYRLSLCIF